MRGENDRQGRNEMSEGVWMNLREEIHLLFPGNPAPALGWVSLLSARSRRKRDERFGTVAGYRVVRVGKLFGGELMAIPTGFLISQKTGGSRQKFACSPANLRFSPSFAWWIFIWFQHPCLVSPLNIGFCFRASFVPGLSWPVAFTRANKKYRWV